MNAARDVQESMFPDLVPSRPQGWIMPSVFTGTNAELMAAVAPMYLTGSVLDVTYGNGKWWDRFTPDPFTAHDLHKLDGVDFRALPEADASVDTVCFDPPYTRVSGVESSTREHFLNSYGLTDVASSPALWADIAGGMAEAARVVKAGGYLLVKCADAADGGYGFVLGHRKVLDIADGHGLRCHDLIVHHTGTGPGGHNIFTPIRARRHHSYLLVFTRSTAVKDPS